MRISNGFFNEEADVVAPRILGKILCRKFADGTIRKYIISEVEAYCGEEDLACHASKGRTARTNVMYQESGLVYVYLIYGKYWMLNFVCAGLGQPHAILIRGVREVSGPGRLGMELRIDKSFYGENLELSNRIWIEDSSEEITYLQSKRVGVDYAGALWSNKKWNFQIL